MVVTVNSFHAVCNQCIALQCKENDLEKAEPCQKKKAYLPA